MVYLVQQSRIANDTSICIVEYWKNASQHHKLSLHIVCWFMLAACLAFCGPGSKLKVASDPAVGGEMMCLRAEEHWYFLVSMMHPPKPQVSTAKWYDLG